MRKIYILLGALLSVGTSFGQAPYVANTQYEFNSTVKHAPNGITFVDMRYANDWYQDRVDFYTEDFDAGFGSWTAAITSGSVGFEITNTGHANDAGSTFVIPALLTSTPTNWVLLDSDSDGASGSAEEATLTSPVIDLTNGGAVTIPANLKVEFEQFYAGWQSDTLFLDISDDGGSSFTTIEIMNNEVGREGRPNPEIVSVNVSPYIVDPTQVVIRMRWVGNWDYGWQFDNISIAELPQNDMQITKVFRGDLVNSVMYSMVPNEQVVPFVIGAEVKNIGYDDQTNISVDWEIFDPSMTSLGSGTSTQTLASLSNNEKDTIWISTGITPSALGQYTINFTVNATQTDDEPANNDMTDTDFEVTDYVYAADYGNPSGAFYNWANNNDGAASIGNVFLVVADGVIGGMEAQLDNNAIVEDKIMFYAIYKFDAGSSSYIYVDQTDDYTTVSGDNGTIVRLFFDSPITVVAGDQIMAVAAHYGGTEVPGWEMAGATAQGAVVGTDETQATVSLINPSAPVVRILMTDFTGVEETQNVERFDIYPNPAVNTVNISLTLSQSENTVINVLDITGKVVVSYNLGTVNGDKNMEVSLDGMPSGVYFIEMTNSNGREVKKFVKK